MNIKNLSNNNLVNKWTKDLNRYFTKEDVWMANDEMEKMLNVISYLKSVNYNHNEMPLHTN